MKSSSSNISPPGPKGHWLIGNLLSIKNSPFDYVNEQYNHWNDIAEMSVGPIKMYSIGNPSFIQKIMNDQEVGKATLNQKLLEPVMGNGLFVSNGELWKAQRKSLTPVFKPKGLGNLQQLMAEPSIELIEQWKQLDEVSLMPEATKVTVRVLSNTIFGLRNPPDISKLDSYLEKLSEEFVERLANPVYPPSWVPTRRNVKYNHYIRSILKMVKTLIKMHDQLPSEQKEHTLITALRNARSNDNQFMTEQQIFDEVSTFFLAGHDTTATTLTWCIHELSKAPAIQIKLREELTDVLGNRSITREDLPKLPYLNAVIDETLRLYPSGYALAREVHTDGYELDNYAIKKNSLIFVPVYAIHRNEKWFKDPNAFKPERWLNNLKKELPKNVFMPFGAGKRLCIGEHFARTELATLIAYIYKNFETGSIAGHDSPKIFPAVTIRPDSEIKVRLSSLR